MSCNNGLSIVHGDTINLRCTVTGPDNAEFDLTGKTITARIDGANATAGVTIVDAAKGVIGFDWSTVDLSGVVELTFQMTIPNGSEPIIRTFGETKITITGKSGG